MHEESLALRRQLKNLEGISYSLLNLGVIAFVRDDLKRARALFEESRMLARDVGNKPNLLNALIDLGDVNRLEGDFQAARDLCAQGLSLAIEMDQKQGIAGCLAACANLSVSQEQYERAARLAGFVESFLQALGAALFTSGRTVFDQSVNRLRENLDAVTFERLWAEGSAMTLDDTIASVSQK